MNVGGGEETILVEDVVEDEVEGVKEEVAGVEDEVEEEDLVEDQFNNGSPEQCTITLLRESSRHS